MCIYTHIYICVYIYIYIYYGIKYTINQNGETALQAPIHGDPSRIVKKATNKKHYNTLYMLCQVI